MYIVHYWASFCYLSRVCDLVAMDAEYLKVNVGETLATGLAAVVMSNPPDPVDFLAKWLLNHVENVKKSDAAKAASLAQRKKDEQDEMARLAVYEAEQQAQQEKVEAEQNKHKTVEGLLKNAKANEGLMEQYVQRMKVCLLNFFVVMITSPQIW
jgi:hypothetical protein